MCTSWDSGALLVEEYEALIKAFPELNPELAERVGQRTGGRKAMLTLSRKDFERHGLTDGCPGCCDISIRSGRISAHHVACRRRMENAIREADPDRWQMSEIRRRRALKAAALRGGSSYSYSSSSSETLQLPSPPSPSPPSAPSPQSWASNLACWVERGRKRKKDEE